MRTRQHLAMAVPALIAASVLALTGCSSSGSKAAKSSGQAGGSSSSSSSAPSAGGGLKSLVPSAIASKGSLTFAMDATYAPDESMSGGKIVGMDADLANAIATQLGLKAQLQNATFDTIIPGLQSGKFDVGMSSFTDTKEREKVVDFVDYFQAGEGFYVKAGSSKKFNGLKSLCGAKVSVETGTTEQTDAQTQAKKCKLTVLSFSDQNQANLAVSSGRADVGFADSQVADYIVKQSNGQFESSGQAFAVSPYGIGLPKGNGMAKAVQAAISALIKDGSYSKILSKWGVSSGAVKAPTLNGATS
ncbi:ABC transporter substrate-binding protein [uncultured Jatrophihabitans sp.]|uniref:ABC transporter substrate-binding protein n=1 Tax=uncultured Jatrophihabitans sp. TaxID=1610747 RepID=UPI0035CB2997